MSSGDDSETAEWEREQMLRGTQSRRQRSQQHLASDSRTIELNNKPKIDIATTKELINQDIERSQATIESIRREIGTTRRNIALSEKSINSYRKKLEEIKSLNPFINGLGKLEQPSDILDYLNKNRHLIQKLSRDQIEMIEVVENNAKNLSQAATQMEVDSDSIAIE